MIKPLFLQQRIKDGSLIKRKQLERLRSEDTPTAPGLPMALLILGPKSREDKVKVTNLKKLPNSSNFLCCNKLYTRLTFLSCLVRCANMKWIRRAFLKIQSGHDFVHRRTDGQTNNVRPVTPPPSFNFVEAGI